MSPAGGRVPRVAESDDAPAIARLLGQLGYPTTPATMRRRLGPILARPDYHTLVMEAGGVVIGFIGACLVPSYELDDAYVRVLDLVVDERARGAGIGSALLAAVEAWAKREGARVVVVNARDEEGFHGAGASSFYEARGYERTGARHGKVLAGPGT
ncbi:MAG: GNAT family N-acetyltransferase [Gemmatimonadota bacterium]